jgi:hypothetical protein
VLPVRSLAYKVKLCGPMDNSVRVLFPVIVTLSCPSMLDDNCKVSSLTVKVNGIFVVLYVLLSIDRRFIVGGVESNVLAFESTAK